MKQILIIALVIIAHLPCSAAESENEGPKVLASSQGYLIHIFNGSVQGHVSLSRVVNPGVVVIHTDLATAKAKWLIRTGTFEFPTRRISFSIARLIGLFQTDTHIVAAFYHSGLIRDRLPRILPPEKGFYVVSVFSKQDGKKAFDLKLTAPFDRPAQVPDETTELGVIKKTDEGFTVFGNVFVAQADGRIEQKSAQPEDSGDKK